MFSAPARGRALTSDQCHRSMSVTTDAPNGWRLPTTEYPQASERHIKTRGRETNSFSLCINSSLGVSRVCAVLVPLVLASQIGWCFGRVVARTKHNPSMISAVSHKAYSRRSSPGFAPIARQDIILTKGCLAVLPSFRSTALLEPKSRMQSSRLHSACVGRPKNACFFFISRLLCSRSESGLNYE